MPPGFEAAAAAAAVNAATVVTRTAARQDDRIGLDHYPTTTIHYTVPVRHGVPQPPLHEGYAAPPQPLHQGDAAPPQLPPSQQWYSQPPSSLHIRGKEATPSIDDAAPMPPLGTNEQNEATEIIVGYKQLKGRTGHKLPITMDAKLCFRQLPTMKKGGTVIADNKIAQRPSTASTPALVGPLQLGPLPPMPPLQHMHGPR